MKINMVYVGKREYKYERMLMSHMVADSIVELHEMANKLKVNKYFQDKKGKPHYDICKSKKKEAMKLGAIEIDEKELLIKLNKYGI